MLLQANDPLLAGMGLSNAELTNAIAYAQAIAEGPEGANRPLEKRTIQAVLTLNSGVGFLPVLPIDTTQPIIVGYRIQDLLSQATFGTPGSSFTFQYSRPTTGAGWPRYAVQGAAEWETLREDGYSLDPVNGEISVLSVPRIATPISRVPRSSIRVTYTGGFDFTDNSDPAIAGMKAALIALMRTLQTTGDGISRFELDDFYSVSVDQGVTAANRAQALAIFRALRSRM